MSSFKIFFAEYLIAEKSGTHTNNVCRMRRVFWRSHPPTTSLHHSGKFCIGKRHSHFL